VKDGKFQQKWSPRIPFGRLMKVIGKSARLARRLEEITGTLKTGDRSKREALWIRDIACRD
jgi:hypothetical protein